jgi:cytochrome c biogenesis protein CcdA
MGLSIFQTITLAAVDAINPCSIAIFCMLLATLMQKSKRDTLLAGILFTVTIYFMYALYGLGILKFLAFFGESIRPFLKVFLLILCALEIIAFFRYKPGLVSLEMPTKLRPIARALIEKANSPYMAVPLAIILSLFLLPCSSGPYFIFLGLLNLSKIFDVFLMGLYLLIFVSPLIVITLLFAFGINPLVIKKYRDQYIRYLHLFAGVLLLIAYFTT